MTKKYHQKSIKTVSIFLLILCLSTPFLNGCSHNKLPQKTGDIGYTIVTGNMIPKELKSLIEKRKENAFDLTFSDNTFLYIIKGYGKQKSGGYSIKVNQFYEAKDTLVLDSDLIGPKTGEEVSPKTSYPYIVLKVEFREIPVTFY